MPVIGKCTQQQDYSNEASCNQSQKSSITITSGKHFVHPVELDIKVANTDEERFLSNLRRLYPKKLFSVRIRKYGSGHIEDINGVYIISRIQVTIRLKSHQ